ncbi:hypothetical protein ES707_03184 [subsurface metagenome]|jgi:hypothetical protein
MAGSADRLRPKADFGASGDGGIQGSLTNFSFPAGFSVFAS